MAVKKIWGHGELCEFIADYARKNMNAGLIFVEHKTSTVHQIPDVLIYRPTCTIELEVKVQRGDFLSDKNKPHRKDPSKGVGDYRFYVAPRGIIKAEELPKHWGLLEVTNKRVIATKVPKNYKCLYGNRGWYVDQLSRLYKYMYNARTSEERKMWLNSIKQTRKELGFIFPEKDSSAESSFLYAAHRQEIIANRQGIVINGKDIIWRRPFEGVMSGAVTEQDDIQ